MPDTDQLIAEARESLLSNGYREVTEFERLGKRLAPDMRVSHCAERYWQAYHDGTAVLVGVFHHPDSPWEAEWGRPDVEVIAVTDRDRFGTGRLGRWADYHCVVSENQPRTEPDTQETA